MRSGVVFSKQDLDSVSRLSSVRKAVYLMQSEMDPRRFRFGGIGAIDGQANTPIRRLGQCTHVEGGMVENTWRYIALVEFEKTTAALEIRNFEKLLRQYFFKQPGAFKSGRIDEKDAFLSGVALQKIVDGFYAVVVDRFGQ